MPDAAPYALLGVMSNPTKPVLRQQWREWASTFRAHEAGSVRVRYVLGKTIYAPLVDEGASTAKLTVVSSERTNDHLFVAGREQLPNVGVVTEKSAYFWQNGQ